jgi:hypothetical protein
MQIAMHVAVAHPLRVIHVPEHLSAPATDVPAPRPPAPESVALTVVAPRSTLYELPDAP